MAELQNGDQVIIVCEGKSMLLSGISNSIGTNTGYTALDDAFVQKNSLILTIEKSGTNFKFKTVDSYLNLTAKNKLSTGDKNNEWTVTISSGNATITNVGYTGGYKLQYNADSPRFACYTSSQTAVQIYKLS